MMLINTKKFSKTKKLHESVFDRFTCAYLHQIALEIMSLLVSLVNDLHMKNSPQKYVKKDEILAAPIRIYMKNAIVFSQSDMRNFFM